MPCEQQQHLRIPLSLSLLFFLHPFLSRCIPPYLLSLSSCISFSFPMSSSISRSLSLLSFSFPLSRLFSLPVLLYPNFYFFILFFFSFSSFPFPFLSTSRFPSILFPFPFSLFSNSSFFLIIIILSSISALPSFFISIFPSPSLVILSIFSLSIFLSLYITISLSFLFLLCFFFSLQVCIVVAPDLHLFLSSVNKSLYQAKEAENRHCCKPDTTHNTHTHE